MWCKSVLKRFYFVLRARRLQGGDFGLRKRIDCCITVVDADAVCFCRQWRGCFSGVFTGSVACWTVKSDSSHKSSPFFLFFFPPPQYNSTRPLPVLHFSDIHPSLSLKQSEVFSSKQHMNRPYGCWLINCISTV